jgi:phosphoribosylanthranilate isomerase
VACHLNGNHLEFKHFGRLLAVRLRQRHIGPRVDKTGAAVATPSIMPFKVKICGLNSAEAMAAALDAGADMVGLNFFAKSPRHVTVAAAAALAEQARGHAEIAAVTVDADDDMLAAIMRDVKPDWLQLHGSEMPQRCRALSAIHGCRVMKAIGVAAAGDLDRAAPYGRVDRLLLDAKAPIGAPLPGGNGLPFDWRLLKGVRLQPFILSGGLTPANVGEAIDLLRASPSFAGVDVSSGVESAPGVKDAALIGAFIAAVRVAQRAPVQEGVA